MLPARSAPKAQILVRSASQHAFFLSFEFPSGGALSAFLLSFLHAATQTAHTSCWAASQDLLPSGHSPRTLPAVRPACPPCPVGIGIPDSKIQDSGIRRFKNSKIQKIEDSPPLTRNPKPTTRNTPPVTRNSQHANRNPPPVTRNFLFFCLIKRTKNQGQTSISSPLCIKGANLGEECIAACFLLIL